MDKYTTAMREAMASVNESRILHTLEFRHPLFKDEAGLPVAVRIVQDNSDLIAPIEEGAPLNAGEYVKFVGCQWSMIPMSEDATANPEVQLTISNVSRMLDEYIEIASTSSIPVECTYRPFLSTAIEDGCQMLNPYTLIVSSAVSTVADVTITARMEDILNRAFLWKIATVDLFPSLGQ